MERRNQVKDGFFKLKWQELDDWLGAVEAEVLREVLSCITWASLVAQLVKNLPAVLETWVRSLGWENPLEKGKATHSGTLAWRIPWTDCAVRGSQSNTTERLLLLLIMRYTDSLMMRLLKSEDCDLGTYFTHSSEVLEGYEMGIFHKSILKQRLGYTGRTDLSLPSNRVETIAIHVRLNKWVYTWLCYVLRE